MTWNRAQIKVYAKIGVGWGLYQLRLALWWIAMDWVYQIINWVGSTSHTVLTDMAYILFFNIINWNFTNFVMLWGGSLLWKSFTQQFVSLDLGKKQKKTSYVYMTKADAIWRQIQFENELKNTHKARHQLLANYHFTYNEFPSISSQNRTNRLLHKSPPYLPFPVTLLPLCFDWNWTKT